MGQVRARRGASTGIGLATAQAVAQSGAAVVVCDVSDETQAAAMVERSGTFGRLDMAYNSAGILGLIRPMMEETAAGLDEVQRRQPARRMGLHVA